MKLENEYLKVEVTPNGGSLTSIFDKKRNKELLYQPLKDSWQGQDVFIFPFIARLKDGIYEDHGQTYSMKNHGLIRYMEGITKGNSIIFESNEDTLKLFQYQFKAEAQFELNDKTLTVKYIITNTGDSDLPFEIGGHPAFKVPGTRLNDEFNMNGNYIKFPKALDLQIVDMDESGRFVKDIIPFIYADRIETTKNLFKSINTIILKADQIPYVDLVKNDGSALRVHKGNIKYLALWSDLAFGDYIAVEPWEGLPDKINPQLEFSEKEDMMTLSKNQTYTFSYRIEILKCSKT